MKRGKEKSRMKSPKKCSFLSLIILVVFAGVTPLLLNAAPPEAQPNVVPSLREWIPGEGIFHLTIHSRIKLEKDYEAQLTETANTFREDLMAISGLDLKVLTAPEAKCGDIFLTLDNEDKKIDDEGYLLEIGDTITIRANTSHGTFSGIQTILQLLKQSSDKRSLQRGFARDFPQFKKRGIMIDAGRKFWGMDYLKKTIRKLAWYKMNFIHMHFTDWSGFRLKSDTYPGLAAQQAYSKDDIRELQDFAKKYQVMLVPEIDLPAHATAITDYNPALAFKCQSMREARWQGEEANQAGKAWTLDVTRPEVREWIKALLDEFVPLFDAPIFHLGGDEYQYDAQKYACPELVAAMKARGYSHPGDVFIEWLNEVNEQIKSYGKQTQIWNWWRFSPNEKMRNNTSIQPNKDILITVWNKPREDAIISDGYNVIITTEEGDGALYVTPGYGKKPGDYGFFDSKYNYEKWQPRIHPQVLGFQVCIWADRMEDKEDDWFDKWAEIPKLVLAERTWAGPRSDKLEDFIKRVKKIGPAPLK
jgi:N-acetyl-beta-hexosaminidase